MKKQSKIEKLTQSPAIKDAVANLIAAQAAPEVTPEVTPEFTLVKAEKPAPVDCPIEARKAIAGLAKAQTAFHKADGARKTHYDAMQAVCVPLMVDLAIRVAILQCVKAEFERVGLKSVGVQVATMLNGACAVAHGRVATRDSAAIPAQGMEAITAAAAATTTVIALKSAIAALKGTHGAQGKVNPKGAPVAVKGAAIGKLETPVQIAVRMLRALPLLPGSDLELLREVDDLIEHLQARFASA